MKTIKAFYLLSFVLIIALGCKKEKKPSEVKTELDKLPAITQEGKNTIGFLVNGRAFTPRRGTYPGGPSFYVIADPGFGGNLSIRTYHYKSPNIEELSIGCYDIIAPGVYPINGITRIYVNYENTNTKCRFLKDSSNYKSGFLKISRYDMNEGIVAGEFEITLYDSRTTCDTIRITNGRFDYKL